MLEARRRPIIWGKPSLRSLKAQNQFKRKDVGQIRVHAVTEGGSISVLSDFGAQRAYKVSPIEGLCGFGALCALDFAMPLSAVWEMARLIIRPLGRFYLVPTPR